MEHQNPAGNTVTPLSLYLMSTILDGSALPASLTAARISLWEPFSVKPPQAALGNTARVIEHTLAPELCP